MPLFARRAPEPADGMFLVVGLGNPGSRFEGTRHNAGTMVVEALAEREGIRLQGSKHAASTARIQLGAAPVLLAVPDTSMNESGVALGRLTRYYKVPPGRILVVCDDLDIPFGTLRVRPEGGSGGHNGLKSVIETLGTQEFPRMRFGVGRPANGAIHHVLGRFSADEERFLPRLIAVAADGVRDTIEHGARAAMNRFNRDWLPTLLEAPADVEQ